MPFDAGRRNCVRRDFVRMEMILAPGLILRTLKLADATGAHVSDDALVGLVPKLAPMLHVAEAG